MSDAHQWITRLALQRHPEGGWFRETYRSPEYIPHAALPHRFTGSRCFATAIYYLLEGADFSAFHRIHQDEGWHFYTGAPLLLHLISPQGEYSVRTLGHDLTAVHEPQAIAPAGWLFAASVSDPAGYSLAGCTVAPGFEFADFEMPSREELLRAYPHLSEVIEKLSR